MDKSNIADIEKIRPKNSKTPVMLLLDFSNIKNKNLQILIIPMILKVSQK